MAESVYNVTQLPDASSYVRILCLNSGRPEDALTGRLVVHNVDELETADYIALSYSWGQAPAEDSAIQLQAETAPVRVRANLGKALKSLRRPSGVTNLWIDAICIDQPNGEEKTSQLKLMGWIYSCAPVTISWLGEAKDGSDRAMQCIRQIANRSRQIGSAPSTSWLEEHLMESDWDAMAALMKRPYWNRIWIVQEVLKSKHTVMRCGSETAELRDFEKLELMRGSDNIRHLDHLRQLPSYALSIILSDWTMNKTDADSGVCPLSDWIIVTPRFKYTEPRDRFYALLGLSHSTAEEDMDPHYDGEKMSDELVNLNAAKHFLLQQRRLLPIQTHWRKTLVLPSWCPDFFTEQEGIVPLAFGRRAEDGTMNVQYQACEHYQFTDVSFKHPGPPLNDKTSISVRLCVEGWLFDRIDWVDAFPEFDLSIETTPEEQAQGRAYRREALFEKCRAWRDVVEGRISANAPNPYGTPDALRSALWRVLIADRNKDWQGPPGEEMGSIFQHYLETGDVNVETMRYLVPAISRIARRAFAVTSRGYLGLVLGVEARKGDFICVLKGGDVPFILRRDEMIGRSSIAVHQALVDEKVRSKMESIGARQRWIGDAYVQGIMQGEYVRELRESGREMADMICFQVK